MVTKHTPCLYSSLKVNNKVPSSTMKVMDDYPDKRQGEVSAEDLSHEWGNGLENYKATFDVKTQMDVRSDILPLTKRYCTYL